MKAHKKRADDFAAEAAQLEAAKTARLEEKHEWEMVLAERKAVESELLAVRWRFPGKIRFEAQD